MSQGPTLLCLASYFKGNRFLERAHDAGAHVILLTQESLLEEEWSREAIDELFALPSFEDRRGLINAVAYLFRSRDIRRIVALDDFDVEVAALLREHFRVPGMGETTARYFRDKLAMRQKASELGVRVPPFTALFPHERVTRFLENTPAPWLLKPRGEASAVGIKKLHAPEQVWEAVHALGDEQSFQVLERMVPGDLYHVDSIVHGGKVVFAEVGAYHRPLLEVAHEGGVYATQTLDRSSPARKPLLEANERLLRGFGLKTGASHTEFIVGDDGEPWFIETSARVGGANIAEMTEAATGINLWAEWAAQEVALARGEPWSPAERRLDYGGVIISLARQEWPDCSSFADPEIVDRLKKKHHIGLVVRAESAERVDELLAGYRERIAREFHAVLPPPPKSTS
jgi:hypothetical protein